MTIFRALALGVAVVGLALLVRSAWGFTGSNHDDATDPALSGRVSPDAMEAIKKANRAVDNPGYGYIPEDHFDRNPGTTDRDAFAGGTEHVRHMKQQAIDALKRCDTEGAIYLIGEALHAIQDFYSHSNYVDLPAPDQTTLRQAFDNPAGQIPGGLKLTGYDPNGSSLYRKFNPSGDGYPHGLAIGNHKDHYGRSGFGSAMEAAKKHSKEFIDDIIKAVGQPLWNQKFGSYRFPTPTPPMTCPRVPLPSPTWRPWPHPWPEPLPYIDPTYPYSDWRSGVFGLVPPEGGILDDCGGTAVFVPEGVLSTAEWFYALDVSPSLLPVPEGGKMVKVREFWPDGPEFQEPVTISIGYSLSEIEGVSESSLRVYEFDLYGGARWKLTPSTVDTTNRTVTFQTNHLGIYGVWGGAPMPVGGTVELVVDRSGSPASPAGASGPFVPYAALAGVAAAAALAIAAGGWYARRRWLR
jgi:hypothetical protein